MGIIDRLSTLIRSNINDLISRAENPQKVSRAAHHRHAESTGEGQAAGRRRDRR